MREFILKQASNLSRFCKNFCLAAGTLIGIKRRSKDSYDFSQLVVAIGVILAGMPLGLLLLGESFSLVGWTVIVLIFLCMVNLDDTLHTITVLRSYQ
jgi:hypothetical protein